MLLLLFLICYPPLSHAQFAEIASLATSLLGSGLGGALGGAPALAGLGASAGSAASQGTGALAQIGQLYQLAQGALQLTGTGVGVLNQASEGNWFPAALEQAAKNSKALGMGGLGGMSDLGALGGGTRGTSGAQIGPEFGTGFPAPDIDDYNDNTDQETKVNPKTPTGLVNIDEKDYDLITSTSPNTTATTVTTTATVPITLFPDENLESQTDSNVVIEVTTTQSPLKHIRIELSQIKDAKSLDYVDEVIAEGKSQVQITTKAKNDSDENLIKPDRTAAAPTLLTKTRSIPTLSKLIDVLRKSSLKEAEIMEIIAQVEGNEQSTSPHKIDFSSSVQNISDKKFSNRERIAEASRQINNQWRSNYNQVNAPKIEPTTRFPSAPLTVAPTFPPAFHSQPSTVPPPIQHYQPPMQPVTAFRGPTPSNVDALQVNRMQREIASVPVSKGTQIPYYQPPPQATNTWQTYHPQLQNVHRPQTLNQPVQPYQQHFQHPYYNSVPQPQYHFTNYQSNHAASPPPSPPPLLPPSPPPYPIQQVQQPRPYYQYRQFQQVSGQAYTQESAPRITNLNQQQAVVQQHQLSASVPRQLGQAAPTSQINVYRQGNISQQINNPYHSAVGNLSADYYKTTGAGYINQQVSQAPPAQNHQLLRSFRESTIRTTQPAHATEGRRYQRAGVTHLPRRRFPTRTARTLPLTTPSSVRGNAGINQLPNQQLMKRFVHSN